MSVHPRSFGTVGESLRSAIARWLNPFLPARVESVRSGRAGVDDGSLVCETERLRLRRLVSGDALFILELLNEPSFIRFIGDKGARTVEDANNYIQEGPVASYARNGFGLYLVELKGSLERIGICGLVKRDALHDIDIGFAFLPAYWTKGYALEASRAVMQLARDVFRIPRVVAITIPDNHASIRLLQKIDMHFERTLELPDGQGTVSLFEPNA